MLLNWLQNLLIKLDKLISFDLQLKETLFA